MPGLTERLPAALLSRMADSALLGEKPTLDAKTSALRDGATALKLSDGDLSFTLQL